MTLILHVHKSLVEHTSQFLLLDDNNNGRKINTVDRRYRKLVLHLPLLNEPICNDTHKLNNLRMEQTKNIERIKEQKTERKKQRSDTHCHHCHMPKHPNRSIMEIFAYASFTITLWCSQCRKNVCGTF